MPDLLTSAVAVGALAGVLCGALVRTGRTKPVSLARQATPDLDGPAALAAKVDGPAGLTDVLAARFGWDRRYAAEVANVAVWHLESPLLAALAEERAVTRSLLAHHPQPVDA
jgi:hypothetical protein